MKKNMIILLLSIIFLSGCSSQYNLKVTSDGIEENIFLEIDKSLIVDTPISSEVEPDDQITPFLTGDSYPLVSSTSKKYAKEVTGDASNYYVKLDYKFNSEEYKNSTVLNTCFQNHEYKNEKDYYEIKLSGTFYCLHNSPIEINVTTPNVVKENNAVKKGNVYTWTIDDTNVDNVDISIKILKKTKVAHYLSMGLLAILVIVIVIGGIIISKKLSNRKDINEI